MTNQQILEKAIQKASDGGWKNDYDWKVFNGDLANLDHDHVPESQLIFNHDFAKALWGEDIYKVADNLPNPYWRNVASQGEGVKAWCYHLQQMVVAHDPIKYLGENI